MEWVTNLIRRVELKINGANAHEVNSLIGQFYACSNLLSEYPNNVKIQKRLAWYSRMLNYFADTGDIKQAKLDNPFPKE